MFQQRGQFLAIDGFGNVIVHARGQESFPVTGHGMGCHGGNGDFGFGIGKRADGLGGGNAVHTGHLNIHEYQIVVAPFHAHHRFATIIGNVGAMAQSLQQADRDLKVDGIIIDDQQPHGVPRIGQRRGGVGIWNFFHGFHRIGYQGIKKDRGGDGMGQDGSKSHGQRTVLKDGIRCSECEHQFGAF